MAVFFASTRKPCIEASYYAGPKGDKGDQGEPGITVKTVESINPSYTLRKWSSSSVHLI